ncbi:MAG: tetratricopeptide repeat protein, partial [Methanosarcinales archaeon]
NKALEINSDDDDAWVGKGDSLFILGRDEEAIECYDKALELNPTDEDAWFGKGRNLEKLGRKDEAEHCFQKAKELGYEACYGLFT